MALTYAPTVIDLSRQPAPKALETVDFEQLNSHFLAIFLKAFAALREKYPDIPDYTVESLKGDPVVAGGEAYSYTRLHDLMRVNDVYQALLAPYAVGTNLDAIVATRNLERLVIIPGSGSVPAVKESDEALLKRFLLSFEFLRQSPILTRRAAAGE